MHINGNLGVGTQNPASKAEISGDMTVDGNSIVNGNLGVGTATPQAKLDVNGNMAVTINGVRMTLKYVNAGEDNYGGGVLGGGSDSCPDSGASAKFECQETDNFSTPCRDVYLVGVYYYYRMVTCRLSVVFTNSEFLQ